MLLGRGTYAMRMSAARCRIRLLVWYRLTFGTRNFSAVLRCREPGGVGVFTLSEIAAFSIRDLFDVWWHVGIHVNTDWIVVKREKERSRTRVSFIVAAFLSFTDNAHDERSNNFYYFWCTWSDGYDEMQSLLPSCDAQSKAIGKRKPYLRINRIVPRYKNCFWLF